MTDIQEYYVLGAMAYLGLGRFKKAQQFLEHVLVVPSANTANGLMLEAYKKWVLVSCLVQGKVCYEREREREEQAPADEDRWGVFHGQRMLAR